MKILIKDIRTLEDTLLFQDNGTVQKDIFDILENESLTLSEWMAYKPDYIENKRWEKMKSLKNKSDKLRSLASGYLLNKMCMELGIVHSEYGHTDKGKPYLIGQEQLAFNISHSGDYVVLGYQINTQVIGKKNLQESKECDYGSEKCAQEVENGQKYHTIGIDIQRIRTMRDGMQRRILNEKEYLQEIVTPEEETRYLNRIWAIKESYVKMTGDGLSYDFRKIRVDFENHRIMTDDADVAFFAEYEVLEGYMIAVCSKEVINIKGNVTWK